MNKSNEIMRLRLEKVVLQKKVNELEDENKELKMSLSIFSHDEVNLRAQIKELTDDQKELMALYLD